MLCGRPPGLVFFPHPPEKARPSWGVGHLAGGMRTTPSPTACLCDGSCLGGGQKGPWSGHHLSSLFTVDNGPSASSDAHLYGQVCFVCVFGRQYTPLYQSTVVYTTAFERSCCCRPPLFNLVPKLNLTIFIVVL